MTAVGIVPHPQRAAAYAERAARHLLARGVDVRVPAPDAAAVGLPELAHDLETFSIGLDFVVSLGGDGTMLRTVDLVASEGVAVLGVNLGQLGFLTEIEPAELEEALRRALAGECQISERMVLSVVVDSDGGAAGKWLALNEAVSRSAPADIWCGWPCQLMGSSLRRTPPTGSSWPPRRARRPTTSPPRAPSSRPATAA